MFNKQPNIKQKPVFQLFVVRFMMSLHSIKGFLMVPMSSTGKI